MILTLILGGLACCVVYQVFMIWREHEADKQAQRQTYQRIQQACSESVEWPMPAGHKTLWKSNRKETCQSFSVAGLRKGLLPSVAELTRAALRRAIDTLRAMSAPHAEVERTREELENAIQAAHEEPNIERLQRLGKTISDCINAYGAACRQQGREEQQKEYILHDGEPVVTIRYSRVLLHSL